MSTFVGDPNKFTLEDAKKWLRARAKDGAECPCCTRYVKIYYRKFNAGMAYAAILIYRADRELNPKDGWFHVNNELAKTMGIRAHDLEYSKLRFWGVLEEKPKKRKGAGGPPSKGYWRITPFGRRFVEGLETVERVQRVFDNRVLQSAVKEQVNIRQALKDKFDYDELMRGGP